MRAQLEAGQVVLELDPALVDPSPVADRMGDTTADASEFIEAIRITGQQVPILVRPHPDLLARFRSRTDTGVYEQQENSADRSAPSCVR